MAEMGTIEMAINENDLFDSGKSLVLLQFTETVT